MGQSGLTKHLLTKCFPLALILNTKQHYLLISRHKWTIRRNGSMMRPRTFRSLSAIGSIIGGIPQPFSQRFQHGHLYRSAYPRLLASVERGQDTREGIHASSNIGYRNPGFYWRLSGPGNREEATLCLHQQIIGLFFPIWSISAITRDTTYYQARETL